MGCFVILSIFLHANMQGALCCKLARLVSPFQLRLVLLLLCLSVLLIEPRLITLLESNDMLGHYLADYDGVYFRC